ncbi:IclR family transcriptional regulator domain-containing protein [Nitriliruptor alkaliphilus]|uniref:IclR family transcriptional regulator domain-containing protein n=1 Tax=Nitriliruptor alkaliphilus TaxID=427918 RepID=UPI000696604C|nr:IclR family transcriptional regulator C-terminal domain-containing protein [Nitriliruptor alkaliphilus]
MSESVRSFERGLRVIRSFAHGSQLTLADVARATDLNRATARRLLLTLEELGYVRRVGDRFALTPRVLDLGYAYLSSFEVPDLALPYLERLSEEVHEASSVGVLDGTEITYVARVPANRVMTVSIGLGTRFPAFRTSLGRALLAALDDEEVAAIWERSDRSHPTPRTVTRLEDLLERLREVRERGYALVDQELELGVRSIAAPLHDAGGRTVAAINISSHTSRTSKAELQQRFVPALLRAARDIDHALANRPS